MRSSSAVVAIAALTAHFASALYISPQSSHSKTISLPIQRRHIPDILAHERSRLRRRQTPEGTVEQTLDNEQSLYYANVTLGTPQQALRLHLDTGSSDLWVNIASSSFCSSRSNPCQGGTYDSSASSTYEFVNDVFNISYVDGTSANGDYATDTLTFGGITLTDFQFGIGEVSSSQEGVLGIGYTNAEVQVNRAGLEPYPNLPQALADGGHINSNAYSLWLNDLDASEGEILFGGVNTAKYEGSLASMPVIQSFGGYNQLLVALTGLANSGTSLSSSSSLPAAVLLDSGATLTYLPNDIVSEIYSQIQAVYQQDVGAAYASCSLADSSASLDFTFSGKTISVPFDELFLPAGTNNFGQPITFQNGEEACLFGIAPAQGGTPVLGDTFLRSAYVVYDLANNEISLAQTVFNATNDDIQVIAKGSKSVPDATPVSNPVTNVANGADGTSNGDPIPTGTGFLDNSAVGSKSASLAATVAALAAALLL